MNLKSNIVRAKAYALLAQEKKANGLSSQGKPPPEKSQSEHQAPHCLCDARVAMHRCGTVTVQSHGHTTPRVLLHGCSLRLTAPRQSCRPVLTLMFA